jgi:ATP-dependent DNA helicase RecQ
MVRWRRRKVLSAALRTGQRFGAGHLIDILRGKSTDKVKQFGHDRLPTFAVGAELDEMGWRSVFRQLLAAGVLEADASAYGALKLSDSARPILKGESSLQLRRRVDRPKTAGKSAARTQRRQYRQPHAAATHRWSPGCASGGARKRASRAFPPTSSCTIARCTRSPRCARRPRQALLAVPGIGLAKAQRYGEELLAVVAGTD